MSAADRRAGLPISNPWRLRAGAAKLPRVSVTRCLVDLLNDTARYDRSPANHHHRERVNGHLEFGRTKLDWLRRYVPLANGIPVDDTIARIISALSVKGFQECFLSWMEDVVKLSEGEIIALDGKTHRRSHDRKRGVKALHMVSAWGCRNGVVLGQVKTDEKSNEITAVPELLEKLELKGYIVTLDAMGCQRAIARQVKEGGGEYVLTLKRNQPELEREVRGISGRPVRKTLTAQR